MPHLKVELFGNDRAALGAVAVGNKGREIGLARRVRAFAAKALFAIVIAAEIKPAMHTLPGSGRGGRAGRDRGGNCLGDSIG